MRPAAGLACSAKGCGGQRSGRERATGGNERGSNGIGAVGGRAFSVGSGADGLGGALRRSATAVIFQAKKLFLNLNRRKPVTS
jgi:hypothetical protein